MIAPPSSAARMEYAAPCPTVFLLATTMDSFSIIATNSLFPILHNNKWNVASNSWERLIPPLRTAVNSVFVSEVTVDKKSVNEEGPFISGTVVLLPFEK